MALAVLGMLCALAPAAASGAKRFHYRAHKQSVSAMKRGSAKVMCKRSETLLGGGLAGEAPFGENGVVSLEPVDRGGRSDRDHRLDDGFRARVDSFSTGARKISARAICGRGGFTKDLTFRARTEERGTGASSLKVRCPTGSRVVSGGGRLRTSYGNAVLAGSAPFDSGSDADTLPDDGWRAYAGNRQVAGKTSAYAICAKRKFAKGLRYVTTSGAIGGVMQGFVRANCAGKRLVIGGGSVAEDPYPPEDYSIVNSMNIDGADPGFSPDNSWVATADPQTAAFPRMAVTAICHAP